MGTLTLETLRNEVDKNLGSRLDGLSSPDQAALLSRYSTAINFAQGRITRKHEFSELNRVDRVVVTPTGVPIDDRYYTMPANTKEVFSLVWQDGDTNTKSAGQKLARIPSRQWEALVGTSWTTATGMPRWYTRWANASTPWLLEFYPVPNSPGVLNRKYSVKPTDLTANNQTSILNDKDALIIAWATEWMFQSLGELEDSNRWKVIRMELWDEAKLDDISSPDVSFVPRGSTEIVVTQPEYWLDPFNQGE